MATPAHPAGRASPAVVMRSGGGAAIRLWDATRAALVVLALTGDRSPVRGCTTTGGFKSPLGHTYVVLTCGVMSRVAKIQAKSQVRNMGVHSLSEFPGLAKVSLLAIETLGDPE